MRLCQMYLGKRNMGCGAKVTFNYKKKKQKQKKIRSG
jgi:hypothetical protein